MSAADPSPARTAAGGADETESVELSFPLRPDLVFLARMTAAAVAARAGFGFDQVEDLRLAIDELCITIAGEEEGEGRLTLVFDWNPGIIKVVGTLVPTGADVAGGPDLVGVPAAGAPTPRELSQRILDALVDEHGVDNAGGSPCAWMVVRRHGGPP